MAASQGDDGGATFGCANPIGAVAGAIPVVAGEAAASTTTSSSSSSSSTTTTTTASTLAIAVSHEGQVVPVSAASEGVAMHGRTDVEDPCTGYEIRWADDQDG